MTYMNQIYYIQACGHSHSQLSLYIRCWLLYSLCLCVCTWDCMWCMHNSWKNGIVMQHLLHVPICICRSVASKGKCDDLIEAHGYGRLWMTNSEQSSSQSWYSWVIYQVNGIQALRRNISSITIPRVTCVTLEECCRHVAMQLHTLISCLLMVLQEHRVNLKWEAFVAVNAASVSELVDFCQKLLGNSQVPTGAQWRFIPVMKESRFCDVCNVKGLISQHPFRKSYNSASY